MFKFVVVTLACSLFCNAAPIDSKVEDNGSKKMNLTDSSSEPKAVPITNYGDYFAQPKPYVSSYYSMPSVGKPVFTSPLKPSMSLQYQGLFNDAKTAHLRPQLYSQSQLYSYPIQSYQSYPHASYPQYYSYGSSYPSQYYGGYGNYYGGYYKQAKDQQEPEMTSAPATPVIVQQPAGQSIREQPISGSMARDASWSAIPYTTLSQDNFGQVEDIRQRDILLDDKYNMQIQPSYLMDHQNLQSNLKSRSADDFGSFGPASGPEDDVYVIMNKYDQHPVVAKATSEDTFQLTGQGNSIWMPPVFNAPVTPNLRGDGVPYSHESILTSMNQFYLNQYMEQMAKANQNLAPRSKSADQTEEKLVQALATEILKKVKEASAKKTEPSQPVKAEEKKETSTSAPKA